MFFHTVIEEHNYAQQLNKAEKKVNKVLDYTREDFATVQNYNFFLEYRDNIIYNFVTKNDLNAQKEKLRDHEEYRIQKSIKKKKLNPEDERKNKQKYIIEEFIRIRKRMSRRETLTSKRLNGTITVESCQTEGVQIEQEDFLIAQKERGIFLIDMRPSDTAENGGYTPTNPINHEGSSQPVPVKVEQAKVIIKTTSEGANAELETWKKLNKDEQRKSKYAGGWSEMLFYERARFEVLWNFVSLDNNIKTENKT
jgi:hypothetical protein